MSLNPRAITIKDIANLLGMAHPTVSRALNDHPKISAETKARVKEAANKLGYVPNSGARSMRMGASNLVGVIVPDIQNEFYSATAAAMAGHCARLGFQMILGVSEDDPAREEQHVRTLRESRCAGVLIVPSRAPTELTITLLRHVATVQFLRHHKELGSASVLADDIAGMYAATEHLIELGHQRIAFIGGTTEVSTGLRRAAGYEAALRKHGLYADPALQCFGPIRPEFGAEALASLWASPSKMTGVVVSSSRQLLGLMNAAQQQGIKIPDDVSVIGYGDADWFAVGQPPITSVLLPVRDMSERAALLLFELLRDGRQGKTRKPEPLFETQLVVRESCARPARRTR